MKKVKLKRKFKYRIIGYAFIMFIGYELTFNLIMNYKLVNTNEEFVKTLIIDSNYHMLYEKKANNLMTKLFSKILNVNEPISLLNNMFYLKPNKVNEQMAYVNNPKIDMSKVEKEPEVFLYNTHQGETYQGQNLTNYNITPGVMMASYLLQEKLLESNVKSLVMDENILEYMNINNMNHAKSYEASRIFLKEALNTNNNLKLVIDIHRDSVPKNMTTIIINNKACAKVLFVIGEEYQTYSQNLEMTEKINRKIEEKYPGLSRGIMTKGGKGNNGVYNQDLSPIITLLELGSEENTIDEVLNTIELIAPIIGEYINE